MPRKKPQTPLAVETKEFRVFNPENIKESVEIPVKQRPSEKDLIKVEKKGKTSPKTKAKKTTRKKSATKTNSTKSTSARAGGQKNLRVGGRDSDTQPSKLQKIKLDPSGYSLIITEKPQAAAKIAAALSNGTDTKVSKPGGVSYYELNRNKKNIIVACAVGHLFVVAQTKGTGYPIFDIAWFPNFEIRKKDFTKKYFTVIKSLVKGASEIIVATDFDIEGEVIGYNIVRFIAGQEDAKRMKFSSLTAPEIQESYDNAHPTLEWGQAIAGETRHFLDWLYGINLSRALMHAIKTTGKFKIMSIGRVQGPALNLIVKKEKEIQAFKPTPYWQVFITINDNKNKIELKHIKDITKKDHLEKFKDLEGKKAIAKTKKTKQSINPPAPFDLTSLQTEAYKFHSITPSQTLQIAQKLYLAGLISYPRTSSQKIPEAIKPKQILEKLKRNFSELTKHSTREKPIEGNKSDPAHPAITPTGQFQKLEDQDKKIYDLVVKRFISCFCDNAELENKKIEVEVNIEKKDNKLGRAGGKPSAEILKFSTKGIEILKQGWMNVYPAKIDEKEIPDFNGEVTIEKVKIEEKQTKPPKRYSPASIVTELEKRNLGTKATRASILETLYNRNYIQDKSIKATELGIKLIDSLEKHSPIIIDEKLTREIEKEMEIIRASKKDLNKKQEHTIQKAESSLTKISEDFKKQEKEIGKELLNANQALWDKEKQNNKLDKKCPNCGEGELTIKYTPRFRSYFIACSNYPNCRQTYPLPSQSLIKREEKKKICEECGWPMLLRIKQGKRPWVFCFNPDCATRLGEGNDGKDASEVKGRSGIGRNGKIVEKVVSDGEK